MKCIKCKSDKSVKNGIVSSRQRYKCNDCGYNYTVDHKSDVKSNETKRLALAMYIEGLSYRSIGKILDISYGTVYHWVKDLKDQTKSTSPQLYYSSIYLTDQIYEYTLITTVLNS